MQYDGKIGVRSDFPAVFEEFIFNRVIVQIGKDMLTDPEYQKYAQKATGLYHEIRKTLGDKYSAPRCQDDSLKKIS